MSNLEKLKNVIATLDSISVPTLFFESVSVPVYTCSNTLKQIYNSLKEDEDQKNKVEIEEIGTISAEEASRLKE